MFDWYTKFVLNASLWTAKILGAPEDKMIIAQAEADKVIENGTLTGQAGQITDDLSTVLKKYKWVIYVIIGFVAFTFYKRYSKR
jgi:hypothetical protein